MGVSAYLVSLALMIALIDALSDPLIGYLSDNTRSRWGRRHPSCTRQRTSFGGLLLCVESAGGPRGRRALSLHCDAGDLVRTLITVYEIPSSSLVAEMSDDYDERTSMLSYRYFWLDRRHTDGSVRHYFCPCTNRNHKRHVQRRRARSGRGHCCYGHFSYIMIGAWYAQNDSRPKTTAAARQMSVGLIYREVFETLASRSFLALFLAALLALLPPASPQH